MLRFAQKCFFYYLLVSEFRNFYLNLNQAEAPWYARIENLRFHYSPCQKLKEEARVRFNKNEMLLYCLDNLKVY